MEVSRNPVYISDLWVDLKDKDRTVLWMEIWETYHPNERKEKHKKQYFVRVNKRIHKQEDMKTDREGFILKSRQVGRSMVATPNMEINVHDPNYWSGYLNKKNVKAIDLQQHFINYKAALSHLKTVINRWNQNKNRTTIKLCTADEFSNHLNRLVDFLNKYKED